MVFVTAFRVPAAVAALTDFLVSLALIRTRAAAGVSLTIRTRSFVPTMLNVARLRPKAGTGSGADTSIGGDSSEVPSLVVAAATTEPPLVAGTGVEKGGAPAPSGGTGAAPRAADGSRPAAGGAEDR